MSSSTIRNKLYDYIRVADDKKLHAIYNLLEDEIEENKKWWKDKAFVTELDERYEALENGSDRRFTVQQLEQNVTKLRTKKYGK